MLPKSIHSIRGVIKGTIQRSTVVEYVVCPKCHSLYLLSDCILQHNGREESRLCDFIQYPRHNMQAPRRTKCNTPLLKKISVSKRTKLVPHKTFVYNNLISAFSSMVSRKGFLQKCEHWRNRHNFLSPNILADIYEGCVWKKLNCISGCPFLSQPNILCLMLNVD